MAHFLETAQEIRPEIISGSRDGRLLAGVSAKHSVPVDPIWIYNQKTLHFPKALKVNEGVSAIAFSPDGRFLAIGRLSGEIRVVEVDTELILLRFQAHAPGVETLSYSPDGTKIVSGSGVPGSVRRVVTGPLVELRDADPLRVWDAMNGKLIRSYVGAFKWVKEVSWSADGSWIATAGNDEYVRIWDANSTALLNDGTRLKKGAFGVKFSPTASKLAASGSEGIWIINVEK